MTERERLIELLEHCSCHYSPPCTGECCECHNVEMFDRQMEHIADHLLANGVIVPPCKVGDTVWIKWGLKGLDKKICPVKVYALRFDTKKNNMRLCVEGVFEITAYGGKFDHRYIGIFPWDSVGKTVFLTKEEAEKALKERIKETV